MRCFMGDSLFHNKQVCVFLLTSCLFLLGMRETSEPSELLQGVHKPLKLLYFLLFCIQEKVQSDSKEGWENIKDSLFPRRSGMLSLCEPQLFLTSSCSSASPQAV